MRSPALAAARCWLWTRTELLAPLITLQHMASRQLRCLRHKGYSNTMITQALVIVSLQ
jgi:hypothetical protein